MRRFKPIILVVLLILTGILPVSAHFTAFTTARQVFKTEKLPRFGKIFSENLSWRADGRLTNYNAARPDFPTGDNRTYAYNFSQVNRLQTETLAIKTNEGPSTFSFTYDSGALNGPGVMTRNLMTNGSYPNDWVVTGQDTLCRPRMEKENQLARRFVSGTVNAPSNALYVTVSLDGREMKNADYDSASGKWRMLLEMPNRTNTPHVVIARAYGPQGKVTGSVTNLYPVSTTDTCTNNYDAFGNLLSRTLKSSTATLIRTQALTWDGLGRLVKVAERDEASDGYNWTALYDGLGRRLRTIYTPVTSNMTVTANAQTTDSWFDPQVEFLEIGVAINGQRTWKIYGPDISERFGGLQGVGGLEGTIREYDGYSVGVINDYFGNGVAIVTNNVAVFGTTRVGGYGPTAGSTAPLLSRNVSLTEATILRGGRMDPSGLFYFGCRYYDPNSGRFISPDPLGHATSIGLDDYCDDDPVNNVDPDGKCSENNVPDVHMGIFQGTTTERVTSSSSQDPLAGVLDPNGPIFGFSREVGTGQYYSYHTFGGVPANLGQTTQWTPIKVNDEQQARLHTLTLLSMAPAILDTGGAFVEGVEGFLPVVEETQVALREGQCINRVWDSRWTPGSSYSGPFGGSYSPGGALPINATTGIETRGLSIPGVLNNAERGGVYRLTQDIPATLRTSIGGSEPELIIAPQYRQYLNLLDQSISKLPTGK